MFNVSSGIGTSIKELALLIKENFKLKDPIYENVAEGEFSMKSIIDKDFH